MDFKLNKSSLGFNVRTASSVPATGNENDIVIISDVAMNGWMLSPDKPSNTPRSNGDVWIRYTVENATFNVLRNATMLIAGLSAKQYIDGNWISKPVYHYQNGEWTEWFTGVLYDHGTKHSSLTLTPNSYCKIEDKADHMLFTLNANTSGIVLSTVTYDLTPYSKLIVKWEDMSADAQCGACVRKDGSSVKDVASLDTNGTVTIDITSLEGEYNVGMRMAANSGGKTAKIVYFALEE